MRKSVLSSLVGVTLIAAGCGMADDQVVLRPDANGEVVIDMDEFSFGVDTIELRTGETVTFVLVNAGDNEHEFMIGRDLVETDQGYPNGFEHDFFETITPIVDPASAGMDMGAMDMGEMAEMSDDEMADMSDDEMADMSDDEMADMSDDEMAEMPDDEMADMSDDEMAEMPDDEMADMGAADLDGMGHAGFMVQRRPGEVARLTVTVTEDNVGEWEIGCFRGRGSHWDAGMRARLRVLAA